MPALWKHPNGQWCKKHKGKPYYFGSGTEDDAMRRYLAEWPGIVAGNPRYPAADPESLTVLELVNQFLTHKHQRVQSGELAAEVLYLYKRMAARVLGVLGRGRAVASLGPADFGRIRSDAAGLAPTTLSTFLRLARAMFAFGAELTDRPVRYGGQFDLPSQKTIRLHRESQPRKLVPAADLRRLIEAADVVTRAQILLGLNAGFGATDVSELRDRHLEERAGWVVLPRRKTGVSRRAPLWKETAAALEVARRVRPAPADPSDADRVFLSLTGLPCRRYRERTEGRAGSRGDAAGSAWKKLCGRVGVQSPGSFYVLKHVFITEASNARDDVAVDQITGHADHSIRAQYREQVDDARLEAVVAHVRAWLWPKEKSRKSKS